MSKNFIPRKRNLREALLFLFHLNMPTPECRELLIKAFGINAPSTSMCESWFRRFRKGEFGTHDRNRLGMPKKFEDEELEMLLRKNPSQTLQEMALALNVNVSTVSRRLKTIELARVHKNKKGAMDDLGSTTPDKRRHLANVIEAQKAARGKKAVGSKRDGKVETNSSRSKVAPIKSDSNDSEDDDAIYKKWVEEVGSSDEQNTPIQFNNVIVCGKQKSTTQSVTKAQLPAHSKKGINLYIDHSARSQGSQKRAATVSAILESKRKQASLSVERENPYVSTAAPSRSIERHTEVASGLMEYEEDAEGSDYYEEEDQYSEYEITEVEYLDEEALEEHDERLIDDYSDEEIAEETCI